MDNSAYGRSLSSEPNIIKIRIGAKYRVSCSFTVQRRNGNDFH